MKYLLLFGFLIVGFSLIQAQDTLPQADTAQFTFQLLPVIQSDPSPHVILHPSLWWNGFSGAQAGLGTYVQKEPFDLYGMVRYGTGLGANPAIVPDFDAFADSFQRINYLVRARWHKDLATLPFWKAVTNVAFVAESQSKDGLNRHALHLDMDILGVRENKRKKERGKEDPRWRIKSPGLRIVYQKMPRDYFRNYLNFPDQWSAEKRNIFTELKFRLTSYPLRKREYAGRKFDITQVLSTKLRSSLPGSEHDYGWLEASYAYYVNWKSLRLDLSAFGRIGWGSAPLESALYLAGGSPEEMYDHPGLNRGIATEALTQNDIGRQTAHLQYAGGLHLRGYNSYRAELENFEPEWYGDHGLATHAELGWVSQKESKSSVWGQDTKYEYRLYAFWDGGMIGRGNDTAAIRDIVWGNWRMDAGVGAEVRLRFSGATPWPRRSGRPLSLRVDFPLFLSRPPATEDFFQFRWLIGLGTTL
ncbi:MAG: hypothetical protein AAFP89_12485 [Bacteroidota bacterium]